MNHLGQVQVEMARAFHSLAKNGVQVTPRYVAVVVTSTMAMDPSSETSYQPNVLVA